VAGCEGVPLSTEEEVTMFVTMTFCALALTIGAAPEEAKKVDAPAAQQAEQATPVQVMQQPAQAKPDQQAGQPDAAQAGLEEKEIDGVKLAAIEANIVSYTNQERARYGLPPLQVDKKLMESARQHAQWMTRNHSMVHTNKPVAENIAMGQPHSSSAVRAWMNSSGHRANILNMAHRVIGVAAFRTDNGTIYWCQQFRQ
jgi:uncharacterized protein YkwD